MNPIYTVLIAIVAAGLAQAIIAFANRKKVDAEATDLISSAAERIVLRLEEENKLQTEALKYLRDETANLQSKIVELTTKVDEQSIIISNLRREVNSLRSEVIRRGGDPDKLVH